MRSRNDSLISRMMQQGDLDTALYGMNRLVNDPELKLSPEAAAGLMGSLWHESGGFKHMQEMSPRAGRGGYGWAQWTGPRRRQYESFTKAKGMDPDSPDANYAFLQHELTNTPEKGVVASLRNASDPAQASDIFTNGYERPGVPALGARRNYAKAIYDSWHEQSIDPDKTRAMLASVGSTPMLPQVDVYANPGQAPNMPAQFSTAPYTPGQLPPSPDPQPFRAASEIGLGIQAIQNGPNAKVGEDYANKMQGRSIDRMLAAANPNAAQPELPSFEGRTVQGMTHNATSEDPFSQATKPKGFMDFLGEGLMARLAEGSGGRSQWYGDAQPLDTPDAYSELKKLMSMARG